MPDYQLQAASLPVRDGRICLVTSRRKARWVIPKGRIDRGHTALQAAETEAWEEAGLVGILDPEPIGTYRYTKYDRWHLVTVFAMVVTLEHPTWPEFRQRRREWVSLFDALERIEEPDLQSILRKVSNAGGVLGPPLISPVFTTESIPKLV